MIVRSHFWYCLAILFYTFESVLFFMIEIVNCLWKTSLDLRTLSYTNLGTLIGCRKSHDKFCPIRMHYSSIRQQCDSKICFLTSTLAKDPLIYCRWHFLVLFDSLFLTFESDLIPTLPFLSRLAYLVLRISYYESNRI